MIIVSYHDMFLKQIYELYNKNISKDAFYQNLSIEEFSNLVINNKSFDNKGCFVSIIDDEIVGFIISFVNSNSLDIGYISLLLVDKEYRKKGIGTKLLLKAENYLKKKNVNNIKFSYTSQLNMPWYVSKKNNYIHPGAPGVLINSELYSFLYHHGYNCKDICDAFFLKLEDFKMPTFPSNNDFSIEYYNPAKHTGLDEFFLDINDTLFEEVIKSNLFKDKPNPFLVISSNNKIVGWCGALYNEETGRAHFDGICISSSIRGQGLGKALFATLANESKKAKASYMTFFTTISNHARYIYLRLGFKVVCSFAIMKKKINNI